MSIAIHLPSASLEARELRGEERLGAPSRFEITAAAKAPIDTAELLRAPCAITFESRYGERTVQGVVLRVTTVGTSRTEGARTYRLTVASRLAMLALRRRSRVFQRLSIPDIVRRVLEDGGHAPGDVRFELAEPHAARRYVVQYDEDDATFVRRLCEDEGLFFRFDFEDGHEVIVFADRSAGAPPALGGPLPLAGDSGLTAPGPTAFGWIAERRRAPGSVRVRDHDPEKPRVTLDATASAGSDAERAAAVYAAPGGFRDGAAGDRRARTALEALRSHTETARLTSTALALAPGRAFDVEPDGSVLAPRDREHVVIAVRHAWTERGERHTVEVEAIPRRVPYRLPRVTPRPRIHGVQTAMVTGAPGEEIHPDELGRVFVRFPWDLEGPSDHGSSLPVRVLQPNVAGSMLLPRVGWEVFVAFEDGDPERPYVLGRSFNAKMPPPFPLPANKMVTSFATDSSPGGKGRNSIHFDDGAGRQHMKIQATFGKSTSVGSTMRTQTAKNERHSVTGDQTRDIAGPETWKVTQAAFETLGSQVGTIAAVDHIAVTGEEATSVGSESVVVGAAQIEQVGNPLKGAANLGANAFLQYVGGKGPTGAVIAAALGVAKGAAQAGWDKKSWDDAGKGALMGVVGIAASKVPGGEALLSAVTGATQPNPWDHARDAEGDRAGGGGAGGGASDAGGAKGPGPGHRNVLVNGVMIEVNGGLAIVTPGQIMWTTLGAGIFATGGNKATSAATVTHRTLGISLEGLGSSSVLSGGNLVHKSKAALGMTIGGPLTESAGGPYVISGSAVTIQIGGALTLAGTVRFKTTSAQLTAAAGVILKATGEIDFDGSYRQSGTMVVP